MKPPAATSHLVGVQVSRQGEEAVHQKGQLDGHRQREGVAAQQQTAQAVAGVVEQHIGLQENG